MKIITTAGKRLREIREARKLTLAELSNLCNVPAQTLNRYELEQRTPKLNNIIKISDALNVNPLWLQGYDVHLENEESIHIDMNSDVEFNKLYEPLTLENMEIKKDLILKYSDEAKKIYEILSELTPENQKKLLELAEMYIENQKNSKGKK